ncbi:MAG: RNA polymerase subunit sigma-70 [Anaerolineaceae bacterium]|nr:RNA polymerase subunit sigma-70 [Anaerolineaceae bacterium]
MSDHTTYDEADLMRRIHARDEQALSELYQFYGSRVYGLALRIIRNNTLAEEVTQDTFLKVWKQAYRWDDERGSVITWMLTITRYTAIDRLRREKRQSPWVSIGLDDVLHIMGQAGYVDDPAWQDSRLVRGLIQQLSVDQQEVIELSFFKAMSHQEMADHLQLPLGTVKSRVRRALQNLRALWQNSRDIS